jgi:N-acetylglucosamine-6-phosphate deacetylase
MPQFIPVSGSDSFRVRGRHFRTRRLAEFEFSGGKIAAVRELPEDGGQHPWIAPGFVDIQSNGYGGQEFSSPTLTVEHVAEITGRQAAFGVTQFLPTITTASGDTIRHSLRTIVDACRTSPAIAHAIPGIHVEGPYIAKEDGPRGAHPREHCRPPDWTEFQSFQEAAEGRVRLLTLSPEYAGAPEFIRRAVASGVVVSIGHTSADSAQIRAAVDAGARLSTHLGNGAHRSLRRHPNYLWDQLGDDRLRASLIVDGHHLPREVVQTMVRAKSPTRCILVSDLSGLAGLPPGRYDTELCELEILADGRLVIAGQDQLLAGASLPIGVGVANVMAFAGVDLATAVDMATLHPTELLGLPPNRLGVGDAADLAIFELDAPSTRDAASLRVVATVSGGVLWRPAGT